MSPSPMRGNDLVQEALPDLAKTGHHTTSDSTQAIYFNSTLGYWNRFEMSARQNFQRMNWSRAVLDYAPDQNDNSPNHAYNEQLACGDEHSVVARYNQNVGHVMTSVVRSSSVADIRFGDYKTIKPLPAEFNKVPDFAITDAEAELLIMGEAKTPWVHGIQEPLQSNERLFRKYLGQIARYMYKTKRKFGFWTSYNETVFLKQEKHPTKKGEWVLWHSPVIQHSTSSRRVSSRDPSNPAHYRDKVSLRECFLYLIKMASEEHMAENKMHGDDWVNKTFKAKRDGYISDGSTDSSSEEEVRPSRSQADDRATRYAAREAKKSTTSVSDLEDRASRLTLDDRQRPRKESRWSDFVTDVHYSQSQQKWYYVSKDQRVYVNLHKLEDPHRGTVNYFVQHETYYEVKLKGRR